MPMTVKEIEAARFGVDKERMSDGGGLYLRLFANGAKRFQVQIARAPGGGARGWVTLGDYPKLSLKAARALAARVRMMASEGMDINAIRAGLFGTAPGTAQAAGAARTPGHVAGVFDAASGPRRTPRTARRLRAATAADPGIRLRDAARRWFENKRPTLSNGKHIDQNWTTIATYILPALGDRPVAEIKRREVVEILRPIWHTKHTTAARTLGRLKEIIELARLDHDLEIANPAVFCTRTAFGYTARRTRHHAALPPERLPELWRWLEEVRCEEQTRQVAQLLILTAKRTSETRFAAWSLISPDRQIWTTTAERMKARLPHRVPLSRQARALLDNAALLSAGHKLVFAKPNTRSGTICENAVRLLIQRFEPGLTGHGFRASFKTWARVSRRYDRDAVEYALAHVPDKLEQAYQRDDLLAERRDLMQDWADFVTGGSMPLSLGEKLGVT